MVLEQEPGLSDPRPLSLLPHCVPPASDVGVLAWRSRGPMEGALEGSLCPLQGCSWAAGLGALWPRVGELVEEGPGLWPAGGLALA